MQDDGAAQLFEFDDLAARIWENARRDPAAAAIVEHFCAGVNAYLAICRRGTLAWPAEIQRLRCRPDDCGRATCPP